jgi:2-amino-4-hydroxy-6-hydroxymethyldihydropteridine diphosphokinase
MSAIKTYIGIGSNLADPRQQVIDVIPHLGQIRDTQLLQHSSLYQTEAISEIEQEDYINAVACLQTTLKPTELLLELQAIEQAFYRQRPVNLKWAPRTMDLDILLYGELRMNDTHLTIPHAEMQNRLFVLQPLREITGDLYIPGLGSVDYMIQHAPPMRINRLPESI